MAPPRSKKAKKPAKSKKKSQTWGDNDVDLSIYTKNTSTTVRGRGDTMKRQWQKQKKALMSQKRKVKSLREQKAEKWQTLVHGEQNYKKQRVEQADDDNSSSDDDDDQDSDNEPRESMYDQFVGTFGAQVDVTDDDDDEEEEKEGDEEVEVEDQSSDEEVEEPEISETKPEEEDEIFESGDIESFHEEDPFRLRYLLKQFSEKDAEQLKTVSKAFRPIESDSTRTCVAFKGNEAAISKSTYVIRSRLADVWKDISGAGVNDLSKLQETVVPILHGYHDLLFANQTWENSPELRTSYLTHVLNHLTKTRDTITKNNDRARKETNVETEYRDQGFVRPSVLILTPLRSTALAIVNRLQELLPKQMSTVHNKERFEREYGLDGDEDDDKRHAKPPKDYAELFSGNSDDCFQLGVSFSRKAMRLYTEFFHSDIIIASPLGLRMNIGGEGDKKREFDYLSSIEVMVLDMADVFLMQNWNHVIDIMKVLNQIPAESHDTDFSRIREWNLEGLGKHFRQTIVLSRMNDPLINNLIQKHCSNYSGCYRVSETYTNGSMSRVVPQVKQVFTRVPTESVKTEADDRFAYFEENVVQQLLKHDQAHTMIYIPSYFDYVRVRNLFRKLDVNFCTLCEYNSPQQVSRSRTTFYQKRRNIVLMTERFHFFKRYRIRGIRHVIFYGLPSYQDFYPELLNMLEEADQEAEPISVLAQFSHLDRLKLERIVGWKRSKRMIQSAKSAYLFC